MAKSEDFKPGSKNNIYRYIKNTQLQERLKIEKDGSLGYRVDIIGVGPKKIGGHLTNDNFGNIKQVSGLIKIVGLGPPSSFRDFHFRPSGTTVDKYYMAEHFKTLYDNSIIQYVSHGHNVLKPKELKLIPANGE